MRHYLRVVAVLLVGLAAYAVLIRAFHLMNEASDRLLYYGITMFLAVLLLVPVIVRAVWRLL